MTKTTDHRPQTVFILLIIAAAYFLGLGALPLLGPDEPRYAEVAREMFARNDWITPTLGGINWFEKPALAYWLQIVGYYIFGVNEFAARAGSAICGLLTIFTIYYLCRTTDDEGQRTTDYGQTTILIAASSIGLLIFAHAATFDIVLTFPIAAALTSFFVWQNPKTKDQKPKTVFLTAFYIFIGIALLAKGLIGVVLPFGIVFCYFVALRKLPSKTFVVSLIWGTLLAFLVAAVWYAPMLLRHKFVFFNEFFVQQQFARYTSNKYQHPESWWFFWAILPGLTLPWTPFFLIAIWKIKNWNWRKPESSLDKLRIFCLAWLLVPLVFFTFSGSKLPGYILPALPAAIVLTAEQVRLFAAKNAMRRIYLQIAAVVILIAAPLGLLIFARAPFVQRDTTKFMLETAAAQGFEREKVLNLHDISHSLEFYAAGRLVRTPDGKQWKFEGVREVINYLQLSNAPRVLVLVPLEHEHQLYENDFIQTQRIADNAAFALVAVQIKQVELIK